MNCLVTSWSATGNAWWCSRRKAETFVADSAAAVSVTVCAMFFTSAEL